MKREKFLLDLVWLSLIVAVLFVGDYSRRDEQRANTETQVARSLTEVGMETSQATMGFPMTVSRAARSF